MNLANQPLGAHLSISKGFDKMIADGESIGCTALQMFLHSNRQWAMKDLTQQSIDLFKKSAKTSSIQDFVVHASYLVNLGSENRELRIKSLAMLIKELEQCEQLGIPYLVLHPGSYGRGTIEECLSLISQGVDQALGESKGATVLLLENTAGQGTSVGYELKQLRTIHQQAKHKKKLGFCVDTCHLFAAGYDFTTLTTYDTFWKEFDDLLGLKNLHVFHLNGAKRGLGSHVDRHEQIGKGTIGLEGFRLIVNDRRFATIPKILETPYENYAKDALRLYQQNLDLLRILIK